MKKLVEVGKIESSEHNADKGILVLFPEPIEVTNEGTVDIVIDMIKNGETAKIFTDNSFIKIVGRTDEKIMIVSSLKVRSDLHPKVLCNIR